MQTAGARLINSPTTLCNVPDQDEVRIESGRDVSLTQETEARGGIPACELGDAVVGETALAFFRDERRQQIFPAAATRFSEKDIVGLAGIHFHLATAARNPDAWTWAPCLDVDTYVADNPSR